MDDKLAVNRAEELKWIIQSDVLLTVLTGVPT